MTIQTISEAYNNARSTEAKFTFEVPRRVYDGLLRECKINGGLTNIVDGALVHATSRRCHPFFAGVGGFFTPMVRGEVVIAGSSTQGRDALVDRIRQYLHDQKTSFGYELRSTYERPLQKSVESTYPISD